MIIGFESLQKKLLNLYSDDKASHAIIIAGKRGIGKSLFARSLIDELSDQQNTISDRLIIEKLEDKKEISIDQIKRIRDFINQTSATSSKKFILIDSACELNRFAANSLLRSLEEPNHNNFFILIVHNLQQILPTIRSRCTVINVTPPNSQQIKQILSLSNTLFTDEEKEFLYEIYDNSPAQIIEDGKNVIDFYQLFLSSTIKGSIEDNLVKIISDKTFPIEAIERVIKFFISRLLGFIGFANSDHNHSNHKFFFCERDALFLMIKRYNYQRLIISVDEILDLIDKSKALHIDKKLLVINIFNICRYGANL